MTNPTIDLRAHPDTPLALNMTLLAHHELDGHGGLGEGMSIQLCRDGRRIIWLAHEGAPKNFSGVDVSDPRAEACRPDRAAGAADALELAGNRRRHSRRRLPDRGDPRA
jgi:hypothetical protein